MDVKIKTRIPLTIDYPKNCFDRLGDDLMELIIGYLPIEDKFKFECLSKRIQSLIFNKQFVFKPTPNQKVFPRKAFGGFSYKRLKEVLTKLKCLTTIEFDGDVLIDSQVLKILADLCPHLRHITIGKLCLTSELSSHFVEYFGQKIGRNINSFIVYREVDKNVAKLLSCASNLATLQVIRLSDLARNELKFGQLKNITVTTKVDNDLKNFQSQYSSSLRSLTTAIDLKLMAITGVPQLISGFGQMTNLQLLDMTILNVSSTRHILTGLKNIAKNCSRLTNLSINIYFDTTLSTVEDHCLMQLSDFAKFTSLLSLKITIQKTYNRRTKKFTFGSFKDLRLLKKLKHLSLDLSYLEDNTFEGIGLYLPKLESVVIKSMTRLTDKTLLYLSELPLLRSLKFDIYSCTLPNITNIINPLMNVGLNPVHGMPALAPAAAAAPSGPTNITDAGIKQVLDNCIHFQSLTLGETFGIHSYSITFKTIDEFVAKARNNRKNNYFLTIDAKILNLNSDEISHSLNRIYDNLTLRLPLNRLFSPYPNPIVLNM